MFKRILILPFFLLLWGLLGLQALAVSVDALESLSDRHFHPDEQSLLPHAVVSVVQAGEPLILRGYGPVDPNGNGEVSAEETLFRIGSTSKLFTWLAVMQLVEAGTLDLDADIRTYLDFELNSRLVSGAGADPGIITLTHLMTHTAGFEDYPDNLFRLDATQHLSLAEYVRRHQPQRLYPAGSITAYSNYGSALAGYIVERVSGQSFEDYVRRHIFEPLGMDSSTFEQPVPRALESRLAVPARWHQGEWLRGQFEFMPVSAGAMSTTAVDMTRFMLAFLEPQRLEAAGVLRETTALAMRERLFSQDEGLDGVAHGWMEATVNGERVLFHGGGTLLFDTGLYLLPERDTGVFVSYSGGDFRQHARFFQAFLDAFYPAPASEAALQLPGPDAVERARALAGEYHQNRRSVTSSEKLVGLMMGPLLIEAEEQGDLRVHHLDEVLEFREVAPGQYRSLAGEQFRDYFGTLGTLVFSTDAQGRTLLAAGGPMTYTRAPWYETRAFNAVSIGLVSVFMVMSLLTFAVQGLWRRIRRRAVAPLYRGLRGLSIGFALGWVFLLVSILITGQPSPVYQLPLAAYAPEPWFDHLVWIPRLLIAVGAVWLLSHLLLARRAGFTKARWIYASLMGLQIVFVATWLWHWNLL